jgi:hypothetical protein
MTTEPNPGHPFPAGLQAPEVPSSSKSKIQNQQSSIVNQTAALTQSIDA